MKIFAKVLQGGECSIEVEATAKIESIKATIEERLHVPVGQQRLILKGRALGDAQTITDAKIVEGDKIFVMIKKNIEPKGAPSEPKYDVKMWTDLHQFLCRHFSPKDANKVLEEYKKNYRAQIESLSLDDIERLADAKLARSQNPCNGT